MPVAATPVSVAILSVCACPPPRAESEEPIAVALKPPVLLPAGEEVTACMRVRVRRDLLVVAGGRLGSMVGCFGICVCWVRPESESEWRDTEAVVEVASAA